MTNLTIHRARLLGCTAMVAVGLLPTAAWAQSEASGNGGLEEIVVTAQKREQSMQDVPIAVTAVTQENLQANRIQTVNDLGSIAPGVTVRPSAGGIQTPFFTIRGQVSTGVVAGSDKQASIYLDGVYIASPRGSIFDLPDVKQLEVLRGPQGTLFGRNATAGAISVTTKDPSGELGAKIEGTYGNYDQYRVRATISTPQFGPFSAYFSFVRNYQRGDILNLGAGTVWDRTNSPSGFGKATSPQWLGTTDTNSYFAALKFESGDFKMVYKYDRNDDHGTPDGTALVGYDTSVPLLSSLLTALYTSNNVPLDPSSTRPNAVSNAWVVARQQRVQGHSLTATWRVNDDLTIKNILAYRKANVFSPSAIDGVSTLTVTPASVIPLGYLFAAGYYGASFFALPQQNQLAIANAFGSNYAGQRLAIIASQAASISKQYSDEIQVNYSSEKLQATAGAIWFHTNENSGGPLNLENTLVFPSFLPQSGIIPVGNQGHSYNKSTSLAAYAQLEYKITPKLEVVGGARVTYDKKSSALVYDITSLGIPTTTFTPPDYTKTKPSFMAGINWRPAKDTLLYFKYSNSFVSGGTTYGIPYAPETASSFELGAKADFLDHKLRANLALFHVTYSHLQQAQGTEAASSLAICIQSLGGTAQATALCTSAISTFVYDSGTLRSQGFELEVSAAPSRGVLLGGSLSYSHNTFPFTPAIVLQNNGPSQQYHPIDRPAWTGSVYASYETQPVFSDATVLLRMDGLYQSSELFQSQAYSDFVYANGTNAAAYGTGGYWLFNGRIALRHLKIAGAGAELAIWGKNLTDRKNASFSLPLGPLGTSANFIPPRTYGVDLSIEF